MPTPVARSPQPEATLRRGHGLQQHRLGLDQQRVELAVDDRAREIAHAAAKHDRRGRSRSATTPKSVSHVAERPAADLAEALEQDPPDREEGQVVDDHERGLQQNAPRSARLARRFVATSARDEARACGRSRAIASLRSPSSRARARRDSAVRARARTAPPRRDPARRAPPPRPARSRTPCGPAAQHMVGNGDESRERAQPVRVELEREQQTAEHEAELLPDPVDRARVDDPERRQADRRQREHRTARSPAARAAARAGARADRRAARRRAAARTGTRPARARAAAPRSRRAPRRSARRRTEPAAPAGTRCRRSARPPRSRDTPAARTAPPTR